MPVGASLSALVLRVPDKTMICMVSGSVVTAETAVRIRLDLHVMNNLSNLSVE